MIAAKPQPANDLSPKCVNRLSFGNAPVSLGAMRAILVAIVLGVVSGPAVARSPAPLYDPVVLNIGLSCQWQDRCISVQKKAMKRSLKFVEKSRPPTWRIELCNRNASRKRNRVDWVGFNNCIRNATLRPAPQRPLGKRRRPTT